MPEEVQQEDQPKKKKGGGLMSMIVSATIAAIVAFGVVYMMAPKFVGTNQEAQKAQKEAEAAKQRIPITAVLISAGSNQTFVLKGAKDVAVVDSLVFKVGSDACRAAIADDKPLIMDALMKIFISKTKAELATPAGMELLKKQIKEAVEIITGCSGNDGVLEVYLYIKAFASTE
jgi:flagellar FliL protein